MSNELETLIEEKVVCGYTVKPWGIMELAKLSPVIEAIVMAFQSRNISLKDFAPTISIIDGVETKIAPKVPVDKALFALLPHAPELIAISLKLKQEEVEKIPPYAVLPLVLTIVNQNMEMIVSTVKNLTGLVATVTQRSMTR